MFLKSPIRKHILYENTFYLKCLKQDGLFHVGPTLGSNIAKISRLQMDFQLFRVYFFLSHVKKHVDNPKEKKYVAVYLPKGKIKTENRDKTFLII